MIGWWLMRVPVRVRMRLRMQSQSRCKDRLLAGARQGS